MNTRRQTGGHFPGWRGERADWVMAGWTKPDGTVTVIASTKLTESELQHRARDYQFRDFSDMQANLSAQIEVTLSAHMRSNDYVVVHAPDYPSAMADLFRQWRPEMSERHAIEPGHVRPTTPPQRLAEKEARAIQQMATGPDDDVIDAEVIDEPEDGT